MRHFLVGTMLSLVPLVVVAGGAAAPSGSGVVEAPDMGLRVGVFPKLTIQFMDSCGKSPTSFRLPSMQVVVRLDGIAKEDRYKLQLRVFSGDRTAIANSPKLWRTPKRLEVSSSDVSTDGIWEKQLSSSLLPSASELRSNESRVWTLEAIAWSGSEGAKPVVAYQSLYVPYSRSQKIFAVVGDPVCEFATPFEVQAERHHNSYLDSIVVSQEFPSALMKDARSGLHWSQMTPTGLENQNGWYFSFWENAFGPASMESRRTWTLGPGQGGHFAKRTMYRRFSAVQYSLSEDASGCLAYQPKANGYLDVGRNEIDFYRVPQDLRTVEQVKEVLDTMYPAAKDCAGAVVDAQNPGFRVEEQISGKAYPQNLFFYPLVDSKKE